MTKLDKAYQKFSETNNVLENTLSERLQKSWDLFNHSTKVNIIALLLEQGLAKDPEYELWVPFIYPMEGEDRVVERLLISSKGRLHSLYTDRYLKVVERNNHYISVNIGFWTAMLHRLIAYNFVPRKKELQDYCYAVLQVNHKDLDKHNNALLNLEWCLPSENITHAYENGVMTRGKADPRTRPILVTVVAEDEFEGEEFVLFGKAELKRHGFNQGNVSVCCKNGFIAVGCRFQYITIGEAGDYPSAPPEGFNLDKYKIPRGKRVTTSWN